MKQVNVGNRTPLEVRNKTIRGFRGYINLYAAVVNTPLTNSMLDLNKIIVKVTLFRAGMKINIASDTLRNLMAATCWENQLFLAANNPLDFSRVVTAAASAVKENAIVPIMVDWKSPIDLSGDKLIVEIDFINSAVSSDIDASRSMLFFETMNTTGVELETPVIQIDAIQASVNTYPLEPRSNVSRIMFINFDQENILDATQVLQNVSVSSDLFSEEIDRDTLFTLQLSQFENFLDENGSIDLSREQSYCIYGIHNRDKINNVQGTLSLDGANVTSNNNIVAMICHIAIPATYVKGVQKANAIHAIKLASLGSGAVKAIAASKSALTSAMASHQISYK